MECGKCEKCEKDGKLLNNNSAHADGGPRLPSVHAGPFARPPMSMSGNFLWVWGGGSFEVILLQSFVGSTVHCFGS